MQVTVFGATGGIGRHVVAQRLAAGRRPLTSARTHCPTVDAQLRANERTAAFDALYTLYPPSRRFPTPRSGQRLKPAARPLSS